MNYSGFLFGFFVLVMVAPAFGQKMLEKPHSTWGKEDTLKLITDSAWAKPYQSTKGSAIASQVQIAREQAQTSSSGGSNPRSVGRDFGPPPVTMRLHSAYPVRQAIVRLRQIEAGYDKMSDADRAAFDASQQKFLECAICKDYYVITLVKAVDSSGRLADEGLFQGMTYEQLKGSVKLVNDKGEERELAQFNGPKNSRDQAVFYFKRTDAAGVPLLTRESKEVTFVFGADLIDEKRNRFAIYIPRTFEFKISKLMLGDKLMF